MKFEPIRTNVDLDVHPDPVSRWDRIAVACMWHDAKRARRDWPDAAVVAPLRTLRGIDELLRNLLLNPQIRIVVLDGPEFTPGEPVYEAVFALWWGREPAAAVAADLRDHVRQLVADVAVVRWSGQGRGAAGANGPVRPSISAPNDERWSRGARTLEVVGDCQSRSTTRAPVRLPAPEAPAAVPAPHGDPGDRIAGDTLADVWPRVLRQAMNAGRIVPTQGGRTRELLNLVAVIRDPRQTVADYANDDTVRGYYQRLVDDQIPEGAPYSYGSRLRGAATQPRIQAALLGGRGAVDNPGLDLGLQLLAQSMGTDQLSQIDSLLTRAPGTRAAYLTPWRPDEDSGIESGRPCLVGLYFRATPSYFLGEVENEGAVLHLTAAFRSHDLYGAYQMNLAAICELLVATAAARSMAVGTVTCTSYSAHVYERDWLDARSVADAARRKGLRWDQRSTWLVERATVPCTACNGSGKFEHRDHAECLDCDARGFDHVGDDGITHCDCGADMEWDHASDKWVCPRSDEVTGTRSCPVCRGAGARPAGIRATALTPTGTDVIRVFEAPSAAAMRAQIEESGLVQEVGNALWLGGEIDRVARGGSK